MAKDAAERAFRLMGQTTGRLEEFEAELTRMKNRMSRMKDAQSKAQRKLDAIDCSLSGVEQRLARMNAGH